MQAQPQSDILSPHGKPFLETIKVLHGPAGLLGRVFLHVDQTVHQKGFTLEFGTPADVTATFEQNRESWPVLLPMFDERVSNVTADNMIVVVVRTAGGEPILVKACRRFDLGKGSLDELINSGNFLDFRSGCNPTNMQAICTAASAKNLFGPMSFAGALWVQPKYRGERLAALFVFLMRALPIAIWDVKTMFGLLHSHDIGTPLHGRYQLPNFERSVKFSANGVEVIDSHLVWQSQAEACGTLQGFLDAPQIDRAVLPGHAHKLTTQL
jgi:hypothetical protein